MQDYRQAQEAILNAVEPLKGERISVEQSVDRVLMNKLEISSENRVSLGAVESAFDLRTITPELAFALRSNAIEEVTVKMRPLVSVYCVDDVELDLEKSYLHDRLSRSNATVEFPSSFERYKLETSRAEQVVFILGGDRQHWFRELTDDRYPLLFSHLETAPAGQCFAQKQGSQLLIWCPATFEDLVVVTHLFLKPAVQSMQMITEPGFDLRKAELRSNIDVSDKILKFIPGNLTLKNGLYQVRLLKLDDPFSANAYGQANCLIVADPEQHLLDEFSIVNVIPFEREAV